MELIDLFENSWANHCGKFNTYRGNPLTKLMLPFPDPMDWSLSIAHWLFYVFMLVKIISKSKTTQIYDLVGGWALPLWKIWVRQLWWWHSQYMEKLQMFQITNQWCNCSLRIKTFSLLPSRFSQECGPAISNHPAWFRHQLLSFLSHNLCFWRILAFARAHPPLISRYFMKNRVPFLLRSLIFNLPESKTQYFLVSLPMFFLKTIADLTYFYIFLQFSS